MEILFRNFTALSLVTAYSGNTQNSFFYLIRWFIFAFATSVDYANGSLFIVNGPDLQDHIEIRGYTFDMVTGNPTSKFGEFIDPHDLAVTSDAKEVNF